MTGSIGRTATAAPPRRHVAVTGLREFWPDDRAVWLISPAIVPKPALSPVEATAEVAGRIRYPWRPEDLPALHRELFALFDDLIEQLATRLNAVHGVQRSVRYWTILVGPWLHTYINLLTHHVHGLRIAQDQLGDIETIGLDPSCYVSLPSVADFLQSVSDDLFVLQLYTRAARALGVPVVETRAPLDRRLIADQENPENLPQLRPSPVHRALRAARDLTHGRLQPWLAPRARVLMRRSYLPQGFEDRLTLASAGRIWSFAGAWFGRGSSKAPSDALRDRLRGLHGSTELARIVGELLPADIPRVFVEDYGELVAFAERWYAGAEPRVVLSTISWHTDEAFGHFAGSRAEQGALLVGGQHGGQFGIEQDMQIEAFERRLVDRYLTWGWRDANDPKCIPTPATRLVNARRRRERGSGILHVGTSSLRFPSIARADFTGYFAVQHRYFAALTPEFRRNIRVRLHTSDFGWGIEKRLRDAFPDLEIERWSLSFSESLRRARLYVADHISTSYTEALATNTPMVMFWDPVFLRVRESARPAFDLGRSAGIVHDTPESAAQWVMKIYPDLEDWWESRDCRLAVETLRDQFARTSPRAHADWMTLLNEMSAARSEPATPAMQAAPTHRWSDATR